MHALYIVLPVLCIFVLGYRYYSAFIAARIMAFDDTRVTPAHEKYDGHNYYPTSKWVLFGHHFAAISGAGPLVGPTLAAQFGYAPGFIWLVGGCVLAGAVHDFVILWASVRHGGKSLAQIAREEVGPVAGVAGMIAILFIVIIAIAGLGIVVVNALAESPWALFTVAITIPLAMLMGLHMYKFRKGHIAEATVVGIAVLAGAVIFGGGLNAPDSAIGSMLRLSRQQLTVALALYGFAASVLPVWLLLSPRDYLSSFMKIGTIAALILGVVVVNPEFHMPALNAQYIFGGGPVVYGPLFPIAFITIACGAISGFHSLISSGTTPKMIDKESHIRPIGYGAMLMEGTVGVMALVAAASMYPGDYFAINTPPAVYQTLGLATVNLPELEAQVGEQVAGRTGGAVSLAIGMAQIFTAIPGMRGLMSYWYHFAIMFEALFILTTIDAGTRVARFLLQEAMGHVYKPFARADWVPGSLIATTLVCSAWGYLIYTGEINTIWPMFGISNQLLAVVALTVATTYIINIGKAKYAWVTAAPMVVLATITLSAGYVMVTQRFWPDAIGPDPAKNLVGWIDTVAVVIMMILVVVIIGSAATRWFGTSPRAKELRPSET